MELDLIHCLLQDLGSILTFLQICRPLDNEDFYKRLLLRPLKNGDPSGVELLRVRSMHLVVSDRLTKIWFLVQALMSHVCIRRTKEVSLVIAAGSFHHTDASQMQDSTGKMIIELPPVCSIITFQLRAYPCR